MYIYTHAKGRIQYTTCTALADTYISAIRTIIFGVVSIVQLVEVTDSAVLGGVVVVVSSNLTLGHKKISAFTGIVDLLYIYPSQIS